MQVKEACFVEEQAANWPCVRKRWQPTRLPCPGILQARVLEWGAIAFSEMGTIRANLRVRDYSILRGLPGGSALYGGKEEGATLVKHSLWPQPP